MEDEPLVRMVPAGRRLPWHRRLTYGVGHVLNDLCAAMWFSYLLLYFHKVLNFTNSMAGGLLLMGQITDGICTPLIGYESDRTTNGICNYGRRKSWHLIGTICVICSFTFIYQPVVGGVHSADWAQFIYYAPFVVIFQFGWAATQISHLSLIPEISREEGERVELNAIRYAFTVIASIFVYLVTFLFLGFDNTQNDMDPSTSLDSDDVQQFRYIVIIVVGVGAVFAAIFHLGTREPRGGRRVKGDGAREESGSYGTIQAADQAKLRMKWSDWFKESQFYQICFLYMFTRLMVNIAQIYIPMYVTDSLRMQKETIALVPLVVYISGFVATLFARPLNKLVGRKLTYLVGVILYLGACVWMFFPGIGFQVYGAAILLGMGGTTVLVTSLAFTADLIGQNTESGAFVYGAMSLTDKISNGVAVEVIQLMQPCVHCCQGCQWFYKGVMTYVTGGAAIGALIVLATLIPVTIGNRRKQLLLPTPTQSANSPNACTMIQEDGGPINHPNASDQEDALKQECTEDDDIQGAIVNGCVTPTDHPGNKELGGCADSQDLDE